ncbi:MULTISPECIES: nitroreductase [unclassified Delftia]|uniref:nitroreductase n=2 Tax=Delftia TaxID=80865 RepID=UPI001F2CA37A|nr:MULTISPECIES: nitroreductase [unclassified Delftia]
MEHEELNPMLPPSAAAFAALLDQRFSCRGYLPHRVPMPTIEALLRMAQRTPSWCNSQPWQVHVTQPVATERLRQRLAGSAPDDTHWDIAAPAEYRGVYRERRRACGWQLYESVGVREGDREASARQGAENFRFFGAPHVAVITTEASLGTYGVLDCGAYVNNFMLAAVSMGLGAIAQAALASKSHILREELALAPQRQVVVGISFGYPDLGHPANGFRTARASSEDTAIFVD